MRILITSLVFVFMFSVNVFADKTITVTLTDDEYSAMTVLNVTPEEWVQHAAKNKARKMFNELIEIYSDKQANKLTEVEKKTEFQKVDLEKEKEKRHGK